MIHNILQTFKWIENHTLALVQIPRQQQHLGLYRGRCQIFYLHEISDQRPEISKLTVMFNMNNFRDNQSDLQKCQTIPAFSKNNSILINQYCWLPDPIVLWVSFLKDHNNNSTTKSFMGLLWKSLMSLLFISSNKFALHCSS